MNEPSSDDFDPEAWVKGLADHPAVVNGTFTVEQLAQRMVDYVQFWNLVEHIS